MFNSFSSFSVIDSLTRLTIGPVSFRGFGFRESIDREFFFAFRAYFKAILFRVTALVMERVLRFTHQLQVFNSIIKLIAVNMVNYFVWPWKKFSSQMLFHHPTMLLDYFSISPEHTIRSSWRKTGLFQGVFLAFKRVAKLSPSLVVLWAKLSMGRLISAFLYSAVKVSFLHKFYYTENLNLYQGGMPLPPR